VLLPIINGFAKIARRHAELVFSMTIPKNPAPRGGAQSADAADTIDACAADDFKPLTADEAQALRRHLVPVSPVRVVLGQALVGFLVALAAWALTGRAAVGWSAGYGALAVVLPAFLLARGMGRGSRGRSSSAALASFVFWEVVKLVLTIALLALAPRLVPQLSWLALLAGMVITMKTYWVALVVRPGSTPRR
jgi:ATP synthase protein I